MAKLNVDELTLELKNISHKEDDVFTIFISVSCKEYSGETKFNVTKDKYQDFINNFIQLFNSSIACDVIINDKENNQNYLRFNTDGMGNITISGVFDNCEEQNFMFERNINKNHLKLFYLQLNYELL